MFFYPVTVEQYIKNNLLPSMSALKEILQRLPKEFEDQYWGGLIYPIAYAHRLEQITNDNMPVDIDLLTFKEIPFQSDLTEQASKEASKEALKEELVQKFKNQDLLDKCLKSFINSLNDLKMDINKISPRSSYCCFFPKKSSSNEQTLLNRQEQRLLLLHVNAVERIANNWYVNVKDLVATNDSSISSSVNPLINAGF